MKENKEIRRELKNQKAKNGQNFYSPFEGMIEVGRIGYKHVCYFVNGKIKYSSLNHFYYVILNNEI